MNNKKTIIGVVGTERYYGKVLARIEAMNLSDKIEVIHVNEETAKDNGFHPNQPIVNEPIIIKKLPDLYTPTFSYERSNNHKRKPSRYGKR